MTAKKNFDCVEMKRTAQERIYEETKHLSRDELVAYFRHHAETGPFAQLWGKSKKSVRSTTARTRAKS